MRTKISQDKVRQLISEFEKVKYFSLPDPIDFCYETTDTALAATSITINGKSKSLDHHYGCDDSSETLKRLTDFEDMIDKVVDTKRWLRKR